MASDGSDFADGSAGATVAAEPDGPDLRRVSDSNGEKVGCADGVDAATDPPRVASVLTTLRGGTD
jgi:hypothetical protein